MTPELLNGLIGAGGALFGGLATFAGVVYQQHRQAKQVAGEQQSELARQAIDMILAQTTELRRLAWAQDQGENFVWTPEMRACVDATLMASLRIPEKGIREIIAAACALQFGADKNWGFPEIQATNGPQLLILVMTQQVHEQIASYLRKEPAGPIKGPLGAFLEIHRKVERKLEQQTTEANPIILRLLADQRAEPSTEPQETA